MNEKKTSLSTHPELNPTPQEPWTAVYSNAGCFLHSKENNGKFILLGFFFWKVALTVPGRHGKWWRCGWACEDVMRNASVAVRVRSSPPPHNKTWEKHTTMEWSWWRTFASHWPSASQTGPPVRHAPLPWVTPCITSISNSCEWKWSLPHIETHDPSPTALEAEERSFLLSEPKQPPSSSQLRTKTN